VAVSATTWSGGMEVDPASTDRAPKRGALSRHGELERAGAVADPAAVAYADPPEGYVPSARMGQWTVTTPFMFCGWKEQS
jgi:hypothetical protein